MLYKTSVFLYQGIVLFNNVLFEYLTGDTQTWPVSTINQIQINPYQL